MKTKNNSQKNLLHPSGEFIMTALDPKWLAFLGSPSHLCGSQKVKEFFRSPPKIFLKN